MKLSILVAVIVATTALGMPGSGRAESYLCVPDMRSGFALKDGKWTQTKLSVSDKFVVKSLGRPGAYMVSEIGNSEPAFSDCERKHSENIWSDQITCGGLGYGFVMNIKSLRFHDVYLLGYLDGEDRPGNTPSVSMGRCSKLD